MNTFLENYSPIIQGVIALIVILTAVAGIGSFLFKKFKGLKDKINDKKFRIQDFNLNHLQGLKKIEVVPKDMGEITNVEIEALFNNPIIQARLLMELLGSYESMREIIKLSKEIKSGRIMRSIFWLAVMLLLLSVPVILIFFSSE